MLKLVIARFLVWQGKSRKKINHDKWVKTTSPLKYEWVNNP